MCCYVSTRVLLIVISASAARPVLSIPRTDKAYGAVKGSVLKTVACYDFKPYIATSSRTETPVQYYQAVSREHAARVLAQVRLAL